MAQLVSVTGQLTDALDKARNFANTIAESGHRVSDSTRYNDTVERLDKLTTAYLVAVAGTPLLGGPVTGPRFDAAAGTSIARHATSCVEYLRDEASDLVSDPANLSRYERKNVDTALGCLKGFYSVIMSAIEDEIVTDLRRLREQGPVALVVAGEIVRDTGKRVAEQQAATDAKRDDACIAANAAVLGMTPAAAIAGGFMDRQGNVLKAIPAQRDDDHECDPDGDC